LDITIEIPQGVERVLMLGPGEAHLKQIRQALGVDIVARGNIVRLSGAESPVCAASTVLSQIGAAASKRISLNREQIGHALDAATSTPSWLGNGGGRGTALEAAWIPKGDDPHFEDQRTSMPTIEPETEDWVGHIDVYAAGRQVRAKTDGQQAYLEAIRTSDLVFTTGPAGTGKTYLAVAAAVHLLKIGRVRRIVLARPAVEAGERLGFLPGDLQQKVNPYLRPLFDALHDMMDYSTISRFIANDVVEIVPLAFMRGRTLNDALVILDEAQNATVGQMKMFLTRMGERSKMIVTGDTSQIDLESPDESGLLDAVDRLTGVEGIAFVRLRKRDIVRHDLVQRIVDAYGADDDSSDNRTGR
jgi:phosphate starvation-inducible protein PhoH and related proteins